MFDKEEIFNGDLFKEKQKDSVPSPLLHLNSLILNGGSILDDYNANSKNIAIDKGQLIKFSTVKHKRQTSSATHHSKKNQHLFRKNRIKGCVCYIFASLFFKFKLEHLSNWERCFLFHFRSSFRFQKNQILEFYILKFHDVIKCLSIKQKLHFTE